MAVTVGIMRGSEDVATTKGKRENDHVFGLFVNEGEGDIVFDKVELRVDGGPTFYWRRNVTLSPGESVHVQEMVA